MDSADFLLRWLPALPWIVIGEILLLLPLELISDILLRAPALRQVIIEQYYSQDLHLILSPTLRPHACYTSDQQKRDLIDIVTYGEIVDFLHANPDITPHTIKIITSQDFRSMDILLQRFRSRFEQAPRLEFHIENYELLPQDISTIFSFPNLCKLQTGRIKLRKCLQSLSAGLSQLHALTNLVFLGHEVKDWSAIQLPPNIRNLDVSWFKKTDVTSMSIPDSVVNLYWNQVGLDNTIFEKLKWPLNIKTLMLTYNNLIRIDISQLPQTLETIDLSNNNLHAFLWDNPQKPSWPRALKSILLNNNLLDDNSLRVLSEIEWPPFLENLRLDENKFTALDHLIDLPDCLKYLDLSDTPLRTLVCGSSTYFKFPELLDTLNMQGCRSWSNSSFLGSFDHVENRVTFPSNLVTLNLSECNFQTLACFRFPESVRTISLAGNGLKDLTSYNLNVGSTEVINWEHLSCLEDLDLFYNSLEHLHGWVPPKSLKRINFGNNTFKILTRENTPLLQAEHYTSTDALQDVNFESNELQQVDTRVEFPRNLQSLNLSSNLFTSFEFNESIANHKRLEVLNLSKNKIEQLRVISPEKQYSSTLRRLDLSGNKTLTASFEDLSKVLYQMGLEAVKRKHNIRTLHELRFHEQSLVY